MSTKPTVYTARAADMAHLRQAIELASSPRGRRIIAELATKTDALTKKDIASWRRAWGLALNPERPLRAPLYDIYTDSLVDGHLSGIIAQRKGRTLGRKFKLTNAKGEESLEALQSFQREWFYDFLSLALDSIYWGHSLIEFGDVVSDELGLRFTSVELIPRKHVVPEYGVILRDQGDEIKKGIPYREGIYAPWLIEVGNLVTLGYCLAPHPNTFQRRIWEPSGICLGRVSGCPSALPRRPRAIKLTSTSLVIRSMIWEP